MIRENLRRLKKLYRIRCWR